MLARLLLTALLSALAFAGVAETEYKEGVHYEIIKPAQPTDDPDRIEVTEVFWYGCPHCYDFEPYLEKWLEAKPDDVNFVRIPGVFNRSWVPHARAFYAAEALRVQDKIHLPLFNAIHKHRQKVFDQASIAALAAANGIDAGDWEKAYSSPGVDFKVKQANKRSVGYRITGVPAMIVNGKYRTSGRMAGSNGDMLKVVDMLVDMERGN